MTKIIKRLNAMLVTGIIAISTVTSAFAADITVAKDTDISVIQYTEETESTTEKLSETTTKKAAEVTTEKVAEAATEKAAEVTTEKTTEAATEEITEVTTEEITEVTTEKATEATTEAADKNNQGDAGVDIDVLNSNYFQISDNYGNIYIYVYTGTDIKVYTPDGKEADVDILAGNDIQIIGDEYDKAIPSRSETVDETTTEVTTEAVKTKTSRDRSSSKKRSSSRGGRSSGGNSSTKAAAPVSETVTQTPAETTAAAVYNEPESRKRIVRMSINSSSMNVDGTVYNTDSSPYISNNYTLVPLRCISTAFDAQVTWDNNTKTAFINTDNINACFTIGSDTMLINGRIKQIPKSAEIRDGRTYVPIRALGEAIGADVSWMQDTKTVLITK